MPKADDPTLPRTKPAFDQDPHRVREVAERNLEAAIGREVRNFRRQQGMTVADLAGVTGLSIGMLSKIENGNTSPSLTTLQVLSHAFSVPVTAFFRSFEESARRSMCGRDSISRSNAAARAPGTSTTCWGTSGRIRRVSWSNPT
jgi:DNA-binding XRE family transcriptional regulator